MNTFGTLFRLTSFGESHGPAIGGVIDGMPAGISLDFEAVQAELDRRKPGQSAITTARKEDDKVEFLSGIFNGQTLGTPIGFIIRNTDTRSKDYSSVEHVYRPGHADYTYSAKYGLRDYRGGGRSSARETAVRVVAGALARQALNTLGIKVEAWVQSVGTSDADHMEEAILEAKRNLDSLGGVVAARISGAPVGLGEPVFGKLQAMLASAMMSINAAKGFEYGLGFEHSRLRGSDTIDEFTFEDGHVAAHNNFSGGIQGGISNGEPITFRVAFKPVASLARPVPTVDDYGNKVVLELKGRHDPCVVPRAVPIVEAMACIVILDAILLNRAARW